jgi:hypothetical protein
LSFGEPKKTTKKVLKPYTDNYYDREIYIFDIKVPFTGSEEVLRVIPPTHFMKTIEVTAYTIREPLNPKVIIEQHIRIPLEIYNSEKKEFDDAKKLLINVVTANVQEANKFVNELNNLIRKYIIQIFQIRKLEYLKENDFFKSIELKVDESTSSLFNASPVRKVRIPFPVLDNSKKEFFDIPQITNELYENVNYTILNYCKAIEKKPAIYKDQNEESLRFLILSVLESRYEATTATGETFNKSGKTDILLKYQDGSNLYVAECKIWKGEKALLEAIDQLIGYLTWRDSKSALIVFVNAKDFSSILDKIESSIQVHLNFSKIIRKSLDKTSISCIFNFPGDSKKQFYLEVMSFHFA